MLKAADITDFLASHDRLNVNRFNQLYKLVQLLIGAVIRILDDVNGRMGTEGMITTEKTTSGNNDLC